MKQRKPEDNCQNHCMVYVPQWQEKLGWKLFPGNYIEWPEMPDGKDAIIHNVEVRLSLVDRFRALISGKLEVVVKTATENVIGETATNSGVTVCPPWYLDRIPKKEAAR